MEGKDNFWKSPFHHIFLLFILKIDKINSYGVNGSELLWLTNYLIQRSKCAVVKDSTSDLLTINNGVPQGSILGHLLLILFYNDFPEILHAFKILQ